MSHLPPDDDEDRFLELRELLGPPSAGKDYRGLKIAVLLLMALIALAAGIALAFDSGALRW